MWTFLYTDNLREENGMHVINAYFSKDDGTQLNTGLGFDHNPSLIEIDEAVIAFQATLV